eukprot:Phypoly_transcript_03331.p1 GENE.Phypoly_transcript_03331~~Phypoly_transcript_03331.p1  ORF type:complete len:801 (+),score=138.01 Phypoly_transcript_03331:53-2455(+)
MANSEQTLKVFDEIRALFSRFEAELDLAEFVVVGKPNCGKNFFIKAFTGFEIFSSKFEVTGVRFPIRLVLHHDPNLKSPIWSASQSAVKKKHADDEKSADMDALRKYLESETAAQSGVDFSREITINIWGANCSDFTLVNTPELDTASTLPAQAQLNLRNGLRNLMASDSRTIICIVDCSSEDWTASDMIEVCRTADARLTRTVFVATGIKDKLQEFFAKEDAESFLRGPGHPESTFTVDLSGFLFDYGTSQGSTSAAGSAGRSMRRGEREKEREREKEKEKEREKMRATTTSTTARPGSPLGARPGSPSNFGRAGGSAMDVFLAMLADKDASLKKVFQNLNVDERTVRDHVGFGALKEYLKNLLQEKLLSNIPTLHLLIDKRARVVKDSMQETDAQIRMLQHRPEDFSDRASESEIITHVAREYREFMYGTTLVDSDKWGQTLGEEVTCVMNEQHPNVDFDVEQEYELVWRSESQLNEKVIINTHEQLYGGAQFSRLLSEIECVVRSIELPPVRRQQLINILGHAGSYDLPNYLQAITTILREVAPKRFLTIVPPIRYRMQYILKRSFAASLEYVKEKSQISDIYGGILGGEKHAAQVDRLLLRIKKRFEEFLDVTCKKAEQAITAYISSTLQVVSFRDGMRLMPLRESYLERYLDGTLDLNDIADRVSTELVEKDDYKHILPTTDPAHLEFLMAPLDNTRELTEKTVLFFRLWAGYLFAAIREHFSNSIRVLLYQHFFNPLMKDLTKSLLDIAEDENSEDFQKELQRQLHELSQSQLAAKKSLAELEAVKEKLNTLNY